LIPPERITDLEATKAGSSITLTWSVREQDIWGNWEWIDHCVVYRSAAPHLYGDSLAITFGITYTDIGAAGNPIINYYYIVRSVDDSGNKSGSSNRVGKLNKALVNE